MENNNNIKNFEKIYRESNVGNGTTRRDKIELIDDFINKMKQLIHQGQFIIDALKK